MTGGVITIARNASVAEIVDVLLEERLSALPVVEPGTQELAGIVSYVDVLRAAQPMLREDGES
jgi:CBS domain-containing protein